MEHNIKEIELKNGIGVVFIDVSGTKLARFDVKFLAGTTFSNRNMQQTCHVMEHLLNHDNQKLGNQQDISQHFIKNGAYQNSIVGNVLMTHFAECGDFEWNRVFNLLEFLVAFPNFSEEGLREQKRVINIELKARANTALDLNKAVKQSIGQNELTAKEEIGSLDNIELHDIMNFYKKSHCTRNMFFVATGALDDKEEEIIQKLTEFKLPIGERLAIPPSNNIRSPRKPVLINNDNMTTTQIAYIGILPRNTVEVSQVEIDVLKYILFRGKTSKIFGKLRQKGLVYMVDADIYFSTDGTLVTSINTQSTDEATGVINTIEAELQTLASSGISDADFKQAKQYISGSRYRKLQTLADLANFYTQQKFTGECKITSVSNYLKRLDELSLEKMNKTTKTIYSESATNYGILGRSRFVRAI